MNYTLSSGKTVSKFAFQMQPAPPLHHGADLRGSEEVGLLLLVCVPGAQAPRPGAPRGGAGAQVECSVDP
jgi:hypothetical protein